MDTIVKNAFKKVCFWISVAIVINIVIFIFLGSEKSLQFLGGYLIELSLSIDNLFVFLSVFTAFNVPARYQHRCLAYGIIGAIVLRLIFISLGLTIVNSFSWILYVFGFLLLISGINMYRPEKKENQKVNHFALMLVKRFIPISSDFAGSKFFIKIDNKLHATPLFVVLIVIELSDILFAIDSVPAVFSVSTDLLVVYTSNICAILGLRQLYFVLEHLHNRFAYVKYGVATILTFTGIKLMLLLIDWHISIIASIGFIIIVLAASIIISILMTNRHQKC